ncbi:MAG: 7-carboxy-7-deazaguanine synthase QueE [Luteibaculum sp.]
MEHFLTLQGEGVHSGKVSYFLRLAGCDVGCVWCDVKESWQVENSQWKSYKDIKDMLKGFLGEIVVVTGGEPCMYDLNPLTKALKSLGKQTHIETSGAYPLSGNWDWITFSPKKFKSPLPEFYANCHELKVVVFHKSDIAWAEEHAKKVNPQARLLLQPEWSRKEAMLPLILEYIYKNPKWSLSLQTHKYIGIE